MTSQESQQGSKLECESFEMAISAMLDGELTATEKDRLAQHLLRCESCRKTTREFEKVNQSIFAQSYRSPSYTPSAPSVGLSDRSGRPTRSLMRFAFALAGTALCVCILFFVLNRPQPAEAQTVTSEQVMKPLEELIAITEQQQIDQALSLKTLEWELRHLKLQMEKVAESPERQQFGSRVNDLFTRVIEQQFYTSLDAVQ